jgi:hypothetical protein
MPPRATEMFRQNEWNFRAGEGCSSQGSSEMWMRGMERVKVEWADETAKQI